MSMHSRIHSKICATVLLVLFASLCLGLRCHVDSNSCRVTTPDQPSGPSSALVGQSLLFTTGGSRCNRGHTVEYRFDFGDGDISSWRESASAYHVYNRTGIFGVFAQARCIRDLRISPWSLPREVRIDRAASLLRDAWADEQGGLWVVGDSGYTLYETGRDSEFRPFTQENLHGVAGEGQEVFACGENGTLFAFRDGAWTRCPIEIAGNLRSVWCGRGHVFAVGDGGAAVHGFAGKWVRCDSGTSADLHAVCGLPDGLAFAVGDKGAIVRYSGESWQAMASPVSERLNSVWIASPCDAWAVGDRGTAIHYDGDAWRVVPLPVSSEIRAVRGLDAFEVYAAGEKGVFLSLSNGAWRLHAIQESTDFEGMWVLPREVVLVGSEGSISRRQVR